MPSPNRTAPFDWRQFGQQIIDPFTATASSWGQAWQRLPFARQQQQTQDTPIQIAQKYQQMVEASEEMRREFGEYGVTSDQVPKQLLAIEAAIVEMENTYGIDRTMDESEVAQRIASARASAIEEDGEMDIFGTGVMANMGGEAVGLGNGGGQGLPESGVGQDLPETGGESAEWIAELTDGKVSADFVRSLEERMRMGDPSASQAYGAILGTAMSMAFPESETAIDPLDRMEQTLNMRATRSAIDRGWEELELRQAQEDRLRQQMAINLANSLADRRQNLWTNALPYRLPEGMEYVPGWQPGSRFSQWTGAEQGIPTMQATPPSPAPPLGWAQRYLGE